MNFSLPLSYLLLAASTALGASATARCANANFASLTLPNIHVLSVDTVVAPTWVGEMTNTFPSTQNVSTGACQITITYTHPGWNDTINTWVWLPTESWNGRFVGMGGGGWVTGEQSSLGQPVSQGYAAVSTDGGHSTSASTASWALTNEGNLNWPLLQDFSAVALDEAASLGKIATRLFYGSAPKYTYWNGCSTGGRQGHMMAQRFPEQYDGILATAPAINWDRFIPAEYWPQLVMKLLDYYPSACEVNAITNFAIDACDELDGVKDGIISLPGQCKFDPFSVVGRRVKCSRPNGTLKITRKGAQFAEAVWAGAKDSKGTPLWYGFPHEAPLTGLGGTTCTSLRDCSPSPFAITADWLTTVLSRNASLDPSTLTLEDYSRLFRASANEFQSVIGTRDPDLTGFKNAGGKMLTWHGMKDQLIFYNGTVDYYTRVWELDPEVHDYYRFFPAPGVEHCGGGPGWYPGDSFQALVDWVENGKAPDTLLARTTPTKTGDAEVPARTAYLCPFPKVMTYVSGDPDEAEAFTCR
ncbi:tannase and feruloyl esterase [Aspergillus pseudoustus]|uniref:Carboxylic ester hydrolase n=1 Tax=Aspergillus pseudoustus TaxID=1810923 RepID=A0ABR4L1U7_9EURO